MSINKKQKILQLHEKHKCDALVKNKKNRVKCLKTHLCKINKCYKEINDVENTRQIIKKDLEQCKTLKNNNQYKKCNNKIIEEKKLNFKNGLVNHCIAVKCPEIHDFMSNWAEKENANYKEKCEPCKKISEDIGFLANKNIAIMNECNKKYELINDQIKCSKKIGTKTIAISKKISKCRKEHCSNNKTTNF
jgi:hypothetical protein